MDNCHTNSNNSDMNVALVNLILQRTEGIPLETESYVNNIIA